MELKEGAIIAGRFRLERLLGKGGMGDVWAAQHTALDIPCAVKFIHSEAADKPEVRERFEREAKAAAALRSPNVVQILDYGVAEDNVPYLAMEYLEGEALSSRIRRCGRLDPAETCRIVSGIARALTKAHAAGIVHRDLKPENVYIVPDEDGEIAKVLDFGVAKVTTQLDSNTRTGALLGTPYYMSPEQAQGVKAVDSRADLWSLAVVAFRCITGELPFKSDALGDLLIRIVTQAPPVPSHVCPGLPDSFDRWWLRASQREPEHRYQSAKELSDALALALGVSVATGAGFQSFPGLAPVSPMQQTVAIPETATPMPGGGPLGGHTPMPGGHSPYGVTPFPGGAGAPHHGGAGQSGAYPYQAMHTPQPFGDSQAAGSMVGMATAPAAPSASGSRNVGVFAVLGIAALAVAAAVFYVTTRGTESSAASSTASATATATAAPPASAAPAEPTSQESADPVAAAPTNAAASAAATALPSAVAQPVATPVPTPRPRPVVQPPPSSGSGGGRRQPRMGDAGF